MTKKKVSDRQRANIIKLYRAGSTRKELAEKYGVSISAIQKYLDKAGETKQRLGQGERSTPAAAMKAFAKRARSILWREDGKDKVSYKKWNALIEELQRDGGCTRDQAIVQASKEQPCLRRLFREYKIEDYDPHPESHPEIHHFGQPTPIEGIENEGRKQSHRENLTWAIEAAGKFLRTNEMPSFTPNDAAYYLFKQACEQPREFLGKFTQVDMRGNDELEEQRRARKSGKRSIQEIEEMLAGFSADEHSNLGVISNGADENTVHTSRTN